VYGEDVPSFMRQQTLHPGKRDHQVASILMAGAALLAALTFARAASYFAGSARLQAAVARTLRHGREDPNTLRPHVAKAKETTDALKKSNLFVKQMPREHPVKQVDGILGDEVLIANQWYKAGARIGEATILAILPTSVTVEWDGKTTRLSPMAAFGGSPAQAGAEVKAPPPTEKPPEPTAPVPPVQAVEAKTPPAPVESDPFDWMGVTLSPKVRAKLLEHWSKMSDEEKEKAKEQWNRMPAEQRERSITMMEQM